MSHPLVSVIVPTYNHCEWLLTTLASIQSQSFKDFEVIVVNDGSPDDTDEVLRSLISSKSIVYVRQENRGQAGARNSGLRIARGKYIAFVDDDDLCPPNKLAWQVEVLDNNPDLVAIAGLAVAFDKCKRETSVGWLLPEITFEKLFRGNPIWTPGQVLIRHVALSRVGGFDEDIWGADDFDLWFRLARLGKFEMHSKLAISYRLHDSNASRQMDRLLNACRSVVRKHAKALPRNERGQRLSEAYNFLYNNWGEAVANQVKNELKALNLLGAYRYLVCVLKLAIQAPASTGIASNICRHLAPGPLWRWLN